MTIQYRRWPTYTFLIHICESCPKCDDFSNLGRKYSIFQKLTKLNHPLLTLSRVKRRVRRKHAYIIINHTSHKHSVWYLVFIIIIFTCISSFCIPLFLRRRNKQRAVFRAEVIRVRVISSFKLQGMRIPHYIIPKFRAMDVLGGWLVNGRLLQP